MAASRAHLFRKRDRLRQLQAFCAAAQLGNMTRAAESLLLSQPAVSLYVRELENEVEAILFERNGPRIALTPAGERLYEIARPLVDGLEGLSNLQADWIVGSPEAELRIASGNDGGLCLLPRVVERLRARYPGIRIRVSDYHPSERPERLLDGEVELLFAPASACPANVDFEPVVSYELVLLTPSDHPLAERETVTLEEIAAYPLIAPESALYHSRGEVPPARRLGVEASVVIEVRGWDLVEHYVEAGLGIGICGRFPIREERRLSAIPLREHFPERQYGLFARRDKPRSWAAERFVEVMRSELSPSSSGGGGGGGLLNPPAVHPSTHRDERRTTMTDEGSVRRSRDWLRELRAFCHTAQLQSVTRAAKRISSSQPAVSRQLRRLEDWLGVPLFERRGPRMVLTTAGRRLFRIALPFVEGMDRLPDTFFERYRGMPAGGLEIAAGQVTASCLLPEYLKRFQERHPRIRVNVRIGSGRQRMRWLRAYEVDIVIGAVDIPDPDIEFRQFSVSDSILITPEDHPLAGADSVDLADSVRYPAVVHSSGRHILEIGEFLLRRHGLTPNVAMEVDGWNTIKAYVEAGIGISVVPELCLTEQDRVWRIPVSEYFPPRRYGLITRRDDLRSLVARWFTELIVPPGDGADAPGRESAEVGI